MVPPNAFVVVVMFLAGTVEGGSTNIASLCTEPPQLSSENCFTISSGGMICWSNPLAASALKSARRFHDRSGQSPIASYSPLITMTSYLVSGTTGV